jgi:hypothetical protein
MASLNHIDMLLGESLECIDEAAGEIRDIDFPDQRETLKQLGRTICELWEVRERIYKIRPDLKRDLVIEYEKDKQRFEELDDLKNRALGAEKNSATEEARGLYQTLLATSRFGYFRLLAEAGLYRVSKGR